VAKKQKYYVVWEGNRPGIYNSWEECQNQITGHPGAKFKSFESLELAQHAIKRNYFEFVNKATKIPVSKNQNRAEIVTDSISVDAACSGNPGLMEYQCVETMSRKLIFRQGPFKEGTNNIGEFLGLVHALAFLQKKQNTHTSVYSDSITAISWVKNKKAKTKLIPTDHNNQLFELIERAEIWLKNNTYTNKIIKWDTESWGEIPADFGRK